MSDWTIKTLKEYFERRFVENDKVIIAALAAAKELVSTAQTAADRAVQKAEVASEKRFEGVNEFRGAMEDMQRGLMPRKEVEVLLTGLEAKINGVDAKISLIAANINEVRNQKVGVAAGWGWAAAVVAMVVAALAMARLFVK